MAIFANVAQFVYQTGAPTIDLVIWILKGIDNAARNGNADFGIHVTVTYVDGNNAVQTLDSGRKSIQTDTVLLSQIDNRTDSIKLTLAFAPLPLPGNVPSFSASTQVLHRDPLTGADVELGPAETIP